MQLHSTIRNPHSAIWPRPAFTLMELLVVMMIMTLLAGLALSAMAGATEAAREQRTRAIIAKIDQLIMAQCPSRSHAHGNA
jgi:prepilin-type N-terminal cleavage/methylation domain-containing protein